MSSTGSAKAQFNPQQVISNRPENPYMAIPLDIDNDGDMDIIKANMEEFTIHWHNNIDGEGSFGPEILISENPALFLSLEGADIDNDGDNDILYLQNNPRKVGWFENIDGQGTFADGQILIETQQGIFVMSVKLNDIDNDNDVDVIAIISNSGFSSNIAWSENVNGLGDFSEVVLLIEDMRANSFQMVDIDNDGETDILTDFDGGSPARLVWHQNLGEVNFGSEEIIYQFDYLQSDNTSISNIEYVDIDTDDKKDIVITSHNDDIGTFYHWFENLDNLGSFGEIQPLANRGVFCDIDNDGDNDIVAHTNNSIFWIENEDGLGTYTTQRNITTEVDWVFYVDQADFNNDGFLDIVSTSIGDEKVAWYENTGILGIVENQLLGLNLYPNPVREILYIENPANYTITSIQIIDLLGRIVLSEKSNVKQLNLSGLKSGILFLRIATENGIITKKIVKE